MVEELLDTTVRRRSGDFVVVGDIEIIVAIEAERVWPIQQRRVHQRTGLTIGHDPGDTRSPGRVKAPIRSDK